MPTLFRKLGTSDEVLVCDCCGNSQLRSTQVLEHLPSGETVYFGSICASHALHPWASAVAKYRNFSAYDAIERRDGSDAK